MSKITKANDKALDKPKLEVINGEPVINGKVVLNYPYYQLPKKLYKRILSVNKIMELPFKWYREARKGLFDV